MIRNALTGAPRAEPKTGVQQNTNFTAKGAPPVGSKLVTETPSAESTIPGTPTPKPAH
jgi:hypothetical protein